MFSIVLGKVEIEKQELDIEKLLPKLLDQKLHRIPYVSDNGFALEVLMKWRYDDVSYSLF